MPKGKLYAAEIKALRDPDYARKKMGLSGRDLKSIRDKARSLGYAVGTGQMERASAQIGTRGKSIDVMIADKLK